ncbi:hypothetical protein [Streptomyces sp. NPDC006307]|uniref:hypothetical protein n=1 Tax=Streptomyces sp. NPDC006307 TaxID=3156748 RepID=UPI0033BEC983
MPPDPALAAVRRAVSPLDHRIEAVTGQDVATLWAYRDRGVLDEPHAHLVDRHRELAVARTSVTWLKLLTACPSGESPTDTALYERVDQLEEAADARDATARRVLAALEPVEPAAAAPVAEERSRSLPTARRHFSPSLAGSSSTSIC